MFTGLVESVGKVVSLEPVGDQARLLLELPFASELALGDSVAINGCCLTVAEFPPAGTAFDLLAQTLKVTSLGDLKAGSVVNLERAMMVGDRFGGHFVQGHVDAAGTITRLEENGQDHILGVALPPEIHRHCIDKGSLTVDGISLTIAELGPEEAVFWITPHTWAHTHLHLARTGQAVNLEVDLLAKYVDKLLAARGLAS
ncbi:riboflavin synthase [Luteolibacter yonseiensis]|uniref:Riboflavin synthase n=1 Tax=Luteolibacter yonseiensis TaxID=1144680 RepID=A0A934V705_9BACT|nr:riboflavin synthase [Luteolibacter yonseiensis]MBK1815617.1 riboflavin synthase [Luteolibacter yonseiensis]